MNTFEQIETRKADEALKSSEVRYRRLFETAKDDILILNVETGKVLDVNPFLVLLLGFSHASFLGKEIWELGFFKDIFANYEKFLELQKQGYVRYDNLPLESTDGRKIAVEFVSNVYQENGHKVIQCNIRDITERKRSREALRESEERFRTAAEHLTDVIYDWDTKEKVDWFGDIDGIMGYPPGGFPRTIEAWAAALHPEDKDRAIATLDVSLKTVAPFAVEYRIRRRDGTWRWWSTRGAALGDERGVAYKMVGSITDVTESKLTEERMREKDRLLSESQRLGHVGSWFYDMTDPMQWSEELYRIHGVSPDTFTPNIASFLSLIHLDDQPAMQAWIAACAIGKKPGKLEYRINHPDGTIRFLTGYGESVHDAGNEIVYMAGTVYDSTECKQAEDNLRKVNEELQTALQELQNTHKQMVREERLSALGQMASGIAHEFNNVLVPILGYSELLLAKPETLSNRDDALTMITSIHSAADDARNIVRQLRLIRGSEDEGLHVPVDINEIAKSAVELVRPRWDKEMGGGGNPINIITLLEADKQTLGDASQLREAMINLILNAVDAMPKGGTVTLSSRVENDHVIIEFIDSGTGMTDETKERCLEPFFTTKGTKGTGLGLSMVRGIVVRHKGSMEIDSILGKGATFRIILPGASAEPVVKESTVEKTGKDVIVAPLRILVADDEEHSRMYVATLLTRDGHTITTARTGREAIDKANAETFDLVITDRSMPEANGDRVALSVKARTPKMPVILLTGFGDSMKDKGECPPGVDCVLSKPLKQGDLRQAITMVMGPPSLGATAFRQG